MNQVAVVIGGGQTLGEFLSRGLPLRVSGCRCGYQSDKATRVAELSTTIWKNGAYGFGADAASEDQRDGPRPQRG